MSDGDICIATGKRIYWEERLANRAITEAAKRGELGPMRHYRCPECNRWHLSRVGRTVAPAVAEEGADYPQPRS